MSSKSRGAADTAGAGSPLTGRLHIEVPHWAASVRLYDRDYQPVAGLGAVREKHPGTGVFEAAAEVPPGIYDVEVSLAAQSERRLVAVYPGEDTYISGDAWNLRLRSVAPLIGVSSVHSAHRAAAQTWSHRLTWTRGPGGDSRLFVFVHTTDPGQHPHFADGLCLLDADHRPVIRLDEGARTSNGEGWLAFSADLPPGYYILRRGRRGVRVRHQGVYLCAGWETQVFLAARTSPSLSTLTLTMARHGAGFRADDRTIVAAEAITDGLRRSASSASMSAAELAAVLAGSPDNAWLSILGAYALLAHPIRDRAPDSEAERLLHNLFRALDEVPGHPDARAIRLTDDEPAPAPFPHPPLLRLGLERVQRHAIRYADTVPLDSLTDCVLDSQVRSGPWTGWRHLDRAPRPELSQPIGDSAARMLGVRAPATRSSSSLAAEFVRSACPHAPVYRLDDVLSAEPQPPSPAGTGTGLVGPVIQAARALADADNPTALPEKIALDPSGVLGSLLDTVVPEAVSAASGLPLARTEDGLDQLRRREAEGRPAGPDHPPSPATPAEQVILQYALKKLTSAGGQPVEPGVATGPPVVLEDLVAGLRIEAERLLLRLDDELWRSQGGDPGTAQTLGARILDSADELLRGADFTVLADVGNHLITCDAAFLDLISSAPGEPVMRSDAQQNEEGRDHRRAWQAALAHTPLGHSTLQAPLPNRIGEQWELWRTVIEDPDGEHPHAFLNVLRCEGTERPPEAVLGRVKELLSEVRQFVPFFAYGAEDERPAYARRLTTIVRELENTVTA